MPFYPLLITDYRLPFSMPPAPCPCSMLHAAATALIKKYYLWYNLPRYDYDEIIKCPNEK